MTAISLDTTFPDRTRLVLLYHFCRLKLPAIRLSFEAFSRHLERTFKLYLAKQQSTPAHYLDELYPLDWYLCCACLEGDNAAWETLFATRTGRSDCLLIDALRARAVRFYPRDSERQENAVHEFWTHLIVSETASLPILARYDGQRPLAPWMIRVFQNWILSIQRQKGDFDLLPDDDVSPPLPPVSSVDGRWHEAFCMAAREWMGELADQELLLLGLRWRYRLSQREVAHLLGVHEGTISRQTDKLRDRCLESITKRLVVQGWTGDELGELALTEMESLLTDEPRMSADVLGRLLAAKGKSVPPLPASV